MGCEVRFFFFRKQKNKKKYKKIKIIMRSQIISLRTERCNKLISRFIQNSIIIYFYTFLFISGNQKQVKHTKCDNKLPQNQFF